MRESSACRTSGRLLLPGPSRRSGCDGSNPCTAVHGDVLLEQATNVARTSPASSCETSEIARPSAPGAAGAADAVDVILSATIGRSKLIDDRQLIDVETACGDIGRDEHRDACRS